MGRGKTNALLTGQSLIANPYQPAKAIVPKHTDCDACDRTILTKDWSAHKQSKKHRQNEEAKKFKENLDGGSGNEKWNDNGGFADNTGNFEAGTGAGNEWGANTGGDDLGASGFDAGGFGGNGDDAGFTTSRPSRAAGGGRACFKCGETGHNKADCPQGGTGGRECYNCGLVGHNKASCTNPRKEGGGGRACYNCGKVGHNKVDCPENAGGSSGGGGQCFNCGEYGHRKSECPNERKMKCRNCEAFGHISRDCPEPKNWNNVQCNNCKKMGHTKARCTEPAADDGYGDSSGVQGGGDSWGTADAGVGAQGGDNLDADVANTWGDAEADNSGW